MNTPPVARQPVFPPAVPTQAGPLGIRYDFNQGCRIALPENEAGWRVRLSDLDSGNVLFETSLKGGLVTSSKRYYVRFGIDVWQKDRLVFSHAYAARNRDVLIRFPAATLGDNVGWFPYAEQFAQKHGCVLTCTVDAPLLPLLKEAYPAIRIVLDREVDPAHFYATYTVCLYFNDRDHIGMPCDYQLVGLHHAGAHILGLPPTETPPRLAPGDDGRPMAEPYVCIGTKSTMQAKFWNNPDGWPSIVAFLKAAGYRVICIDRDATHDKNGAHNPFPLGAEDQTGERPLQERVRWLRHCDFFVGLSSGLAWLAWAAGRPVVLISGFSHPRNEFDTPYRVINYHTCNSCWNDARLPFDHNDFLWCPRHKGTPRQFECTRFITADQVKDAIRRVPEFAARNGSAPG
jgi:autotransporter strand-loop-strand O-heptosyltransferase